MKRMLSCRCESHFCQWARRQRNRAAMCRLYDQRRNTAHSIIIAPVSSSIGDTCTFGCDEDDDRATKRLYAARFCFIPTKCIIQATVRERRQPGVEHSDDR